MQGITTQSGKFYGWTSEDGLFNRDGEHVGQIYRGIIYNEDGIYVGEIRDGRLVTDVLRRETHRWYGYLKNSLTVKGDMEADLPPLPMPAGYEEFPTLSHDDQNQKLILPTTESHDVID